MTSPASVEAGRVKRVLEQELDRGCRDTLVVGGLDRMLIQMREDGLLQQFPNLQQNVRHLPPGGYRALTPEARARWLRESIRAIAAPPPPVVPKSGARRRAVASRVRSSPSAAAMPAFRPASPLTALPGVTSSVAAKFEKLGVKTLNDAALLFPRRFNDFTNVRGVSTLDPNAGIQVVVGDVLAANQRRFGRRVAASEALVTDGSGTLRVTWFNQPYVARALQSAGRVVLAGRVRVYRGQLQMENPEWEPYDIEGMAGRLVPVYPATQGLGQRTIRKVVKQALDAISGTMHDAVSPHVAARLGLPPVASAALAYHYPDSLEAAEKARRRLALGEFLAIQAAVLQRRARWQEANDAPVLDDFGWLEGFKTSLPFALTGAQERVLEELKSDINSYVPMLRLLQGDVGSGKTVVAFAAMLAAVAAGRQAALMVPTEILAEQHYRNLARLLGGDDFSPLEGLFVPPWFDRPVRATLLTGSLAASQKQLVRSGAANDGVDLLIGTHALLEGAVDIPRLGLAVIDEQHRFGVSQREKLRHKGQNPHLLVMTATPIPRTLALTIYGDLESSVIDEMPTGRLPIKTHWVRPRRREEAYEFIRKRLDAGEQCFVICPLVEDSDVLDARSAEEEYERLRNGPFKSYRLELLHGRMPGRQKDETMERFARHETDILVSTSVIEVGIDVPNATVMLIEGAERFGISQLHQFRGRVGRSALQSHCFLFSTEEDPGPDARERLEALVETNDGFELAEVDLRLRGEGEAWGRIQSGANTMLRVARVSDRDILAQAREIASSILASDPWLQNPSNATLAEAARPFLERAAEAN